MTAETTTTTMYLLPPFLVPALAGYLLMYGMNYTRAELARLAGHHLLFHSALAGIALFIVAGVLVDVAEGIAPWLCPTLLQVWGKVVSLIPVPWPETTIVATMLAIMILSIANKRIGKFDAYVKTAYQMGEEIEALVSEAMEDIRQIEVSLRSGKSYVGFPVRIGTSPFAGRRSDVSVFPMLSGHRCKKTKELVVTKNYAPVLLNHMDDINAWDDYRIVLPASEIVSVRPFDDDLWSKFQQNP